MSSREFNHPVGLTPIRVIVLGAFGILFLSATVFRGDSGEKMNYTDT